MQDFTGPGADKAGLQTRSGDSPAAQPVEGEPSALPVQANEHERHST